ncbi:hypothetical protein E3N88_39245 [Mikania micrantha]|uniref:Cytochrome P450 n=1 Tax=Mikania micrantha TaxID=192012 RepID=A0A5N6LW99_9ASTR|nr:hypothetical protein E3N88_39245 [Mikania micrantha]
MNILHKITIFIFIYFSSTNAFPNFFPNVSSIPPSFLPNTTAVAWDDFNKLSRCRLGQNVTGISKLKNYFHYFGYITNTTGNFTDDFDDDLESAVSKRKKVAHDKVNNKLAPLAKGAWPIIGHLHLLGKNRLAHRVLGDMADKYGPIFTMKLGAHQVLVVSSVEAAKECFTTSDKAFASRPKSKAVEIMGYNYAMFGLAPYGEYWRQVRKIAVLEILSQKRVDMLEYARVSEVRTSTNEIYEAWRVNKESEGSDMVMVDMKQWFTNLILNVLVRIISGKRFPFKSAEGVRFQKMEKKLFELLGAFVVSDLIPFMKRFDVGGYEKQMKMAAEEINDIMEGWLRNRRIQKDSAGGQQQEGDQFFMDVLISVLKDASEADFPEPYEFKPERFLTSHKDVDVKGKHFELLPFGSGRRMCPAITFVLQILPLTLANLIQQFEISKPSNEPIDMTEAPGLTTKRANPLDVLLAPRLSLKMYPVDV